MPGWGWIIVGILLLQGFAWALLATAKRGDALGFKIDRGRAAEAGQGVPIQSLLVSANTDESEERPPHRLGRPFR